MLITAPQRLRNALIALVLFHILIIIASNYLVQLPITLFGWHTTWGAFSFPFIFLATDLTVRLLGKQAARRVIARVMLPALLISYIVSVLFQEASFRGFGALLEFNEFVLRISIASFLAYVLGQFLDIQVFDRLRQLSLWWVAPTVSTVLGNLLDTYAFFSVAFWNSSNPFMAEHWVEIATVDYGVKLVVSLLLFVPLYGMLLNAILRILAGRDGRTPPATPANSGPH
ncbi:7-cyano-7-deazaguanine/7-aminomethyl-7-deazaguanine transporter [Pseudomonas anguilliseptica]|uniref:7-cyano-7-deazaguanine/7-aminomethyl-7- deazaguanine transporter n=1 Tax=Pseudomonas anguilliseptica TaxID=53406 RepID=UPI0022AFA681|nr:7-cyano-7-deazaguanine/7-aminomethyl-7-deazaguanine transporter [Pseudomonas anguilliseptica]MCZ4321611.1 7-cyano-7-deazaguanine/7-aminomethyl-7-deazaguanine transporter [Pseudomonas anguilliseptica]